MTNDNVLNTTLMELVLFLLFVSFLFAAALNVRDEPDPPRIFPPRGSACSVPFIVPNLIPSSVLCPPSVLGSSDGLSLPGFLALGEYFLSRTGVDPSPCVLDADLNPQPQFDITIQNRQFRIRRTADARGDEQVDAIPNIDRFSDQEFVSRADFEDWADELLGYSQDVETFNGNCRLYANVTVGTTSHPRGVVDRLNKYFMISNGRAVTDRLDVLDPVPE